MAPVPVNGEKNRLFGESPSRIRAVASEHLAMGPGAGRRVKHRPRAAGEVTGVGIELPTTGGWGRHQNFTAGRLRPRSLAGQHHLDFDSPNLLKQRRNRYLIRFRFGTIFR